MCSTSLCFTIKQLPILLKLKLEMGFVLCQYVHKYCNYTESRQPKPVTKPNHGIFARSIAADFQTIMCPDFCNTSLGLDKQLIYIYFYEATSNWFDEIQFWCCFEYYWVHYLRLAPLFSALEVPCGCFYGVTVVMLFYTVVVVVWQTSSYWLLCFLELPLVPIATTTTSTTTE